MTMMMHSRDMFPSYYHGNHYLMPQSDWWNRRRPFPLSRRNGRRERFFDMEKPFESFMQNIDRRFSGMLGVIGRDDVMDRDVMIPVNHEGKEEKNRMTDNSKKGYYMIEVDVQDFKPEEVTVEVKDGLANVHAKRETKNEGDGMYAYTYREFKRTFTLPKGMKTEDVKSTLSDNGILKIEGSHEVVGNVVGNVQRCNAICDVPISVKHEK